MEATPLIVELAVALVAATVGAVLAVRLGVSPIVGYIVAGIAIGPYTPGLVGDAEVVRSVADIGVVFLMFAIGAQVSLPDLARVGRLASIGGVVQTLVLLGAGYLVGLAIGLTPLEALFLGAVASNSSSMVLGKVLGDRGETETEHGHTALAWSTVQDLGTIVVQSSCWVRSPPRPRRSRRIIPLALVKAAVFLVVVFVVGSRVVPSIIERMASLGSREVFLLGVAALALGTAYAATLFGSRLPSARSSPASSSASRDSPAASSERPCPSATSSRGSSSSPSACSSTRSSWSSTSARHSKSCCSSSR